MTQLHKGSFSGRLRLRHATARYVNFGASQIYPAAAPRGDGLEAQIILIIVGLRAAPGFIGGVQTVFELEAAQRRRGACCMLLPVTATELASGVTER